MEVNTPLKKLDIRGYSVIDTNIIRLIRWYFNKKNVTILFFHKSEMINPNENLRVNGNVGI